MSNPWADPALQRPCSDRNDLQWPAAYGAAQPHIPAMRRELSAADGGGGFWLHVAEPEQVACQWSWVIDAGAHGGSLIRALQSRRVFTPTGGSGGGGSSGNSGGQQPAGNSGTNAPPGGNPADQISGWIQRNPLLAIGGAALLMFALAKR